MSFANRWLGVAVACASLWGCAASPKPVRSVAEYDLTCERVEVTRIDDQHYAASGCGRGAVYVRTCDDAGSCQWARLRHGHEIDVAAGEQLPPQLSEQPPREIIPAPEPEQREVLPAPPPAEREILPAPPPASSGGEAPQTAPAATPSTSAPAADTSQQQIAVTEQQLSAPYQVEVPAVPPAQRVQYAPPVALVETLPPAPAPTYVWVRGYWWWGTWGWSWVPGYWCPPRPGFSFIYGGWYWANNWWWYYPGGWGYPGSRVVVYAPSPRPQRVVTVRTVHPRAIAASHGGSYAQGSGGMNRPRQVTPAPAPGGTRPFTPHGTTLTPSQPVATRPFTPRGSNLYPSAQAPANTRPFTPRASNLYPSAQAPVATRPFTPRSSPLYPATPARPGLSAQAPGRLVVPHQTVPPRNVYTPSAPRQPASGFSRPWTSDRASQPSRPSSSGLRNERVLRSPSYPTRITPSPSSSGARRPAPSFRGGSAPRMPSSGFRGGPSGGGSRPAPSGGGGAHRPR